MIEIIAVSVLWAINMSILLLIILLYYKKKEESFNRVDISPVIIGMSLWEAIFTIMCVVVIISNLSV